MPNTVAGLGVPVGSSRLGGFCGLSYFCGQSVEGEVLNPIFHDHEVNVWADCSNGHLPVPEFHSLNARQYAFPCLPSRGSSRGVVRCTVKCPEINLAGFLVL